MNATCHVPSAPRRKKAARPPAMSQFYRIFHFGSEVEPPKAADIEIQGGIVVAAHQPLAFMIGWAIEKVLERVVRNNFKFCTLPGAARTSLFVTTPTSLAQRSLAKVAVNVKPAKPVVPAKTASKRVKIKASTLEETTAGQRIPSSMASLPKTVVSMGKRVR